MKTAGRACKIISNTRIANKIITNCGGERLGDLRELVEDIGSDVEIEVDEEVDVTREEELELEMEPELELELEELVVVDTTSVMLVLVLDEEAELELEFEKEPLEVVDVDTAAAGLAWGRLDPSTVVEGTVERGTVVVALPACRGANSMRRLRGRLYGWRCIGGVRAKHNETKTIRTRIADEKVQA